MFPKIIPRHHTIEFSNAIGYTDSKSPPVVNILAFIFLIVTLSISAIIPLFASCPFFCPYAIMSLHWSKRWIALTSNLLAFYLSMFHEILRGRTCATILMWCSPIPYTSVTLYLGLNRIGNPVLVAYEFWFWQGVKDPPSGLYPWLDRWQVGPCFGHAD